MLSEAAVNFQLNLGQLLSILLNPATGEVYTPTGNVLPPGTLEVNSYFNIENNICTVVSPPYMNDKTLYEVQTTETLPFTYPFVTPLRLELK